MKKNLICGFAAMMLCIGNLNVQGREKPTPADTPLSQQEKLDRGFVRIQTGTASAFLSWRLQNTDDEHTSFIILKNDEPATEPLRDVTSYRIIASKTVDLKLVTLQNGVPTDTIEPQTFNAATHHVLQLQRPNGGTAGSGSDAND